MREGGGGKIAIMGVLIILIERKNCCVLLYPVVPITATSFPGPFPWLGGGACPRKPGKRPWEQDCMKWGKVFKN